jgi:hypothetical protein
MKAIVEAVAARHPLSLDVVDISTDAALEARYGQEIPVLLVDGRKVAKYRIGEADLERSLRAISTGRPSRQGQEGPDGQEGREGRNTRTT